MKKTNIKKFTVSALLGVLLCFGCVFGMVGFSHTAKADGVNQTKTWKIDTSFRTRVTTELSKATDFKGGTIEFDLIDSDLKRDFDGNVSVIPDDYKLKNHSFDKSYAYNMRRQNYASINFNFYKTNETIGVYSWRVGGTDDAADKKQNENQLAAFSYYADGRIVEYSGDAGNYLSRDQRVVTPSDAGFVGTQEDVDSFMEPKNSYRIEWVWGTVKADKTVIVSSPEEMKNSGASARQAWYVVYSKPLSAPASDYKVLFAFKTSKAASMLQAAETANTLGGYAGFEISANIGYMRNVNGDNKYVLEKNTVNGGWNGFDQNVRMELDNVAIYDGYDYESGEKKSKSGFENTYESFTGLSDSGIESANRAATPTAEPKPTNGDAAHYEYGAYGGKLTDIYWDSHNATVDGLRVQIVNSSKESISSPAKSEINSRNTHTVTFTDGTNTLFTQEVIDTFPATISGNRFGGKFYRWTIPTDADLESVTSDITIVGTATDKRYIIYDANGGSGEIDRVEETVGTSVTLSDGTGLTRRPAYDLIGWSTDKNGEKEFDLSGNYTVTDDDVTLYAVWKLISYETKFTMPDGTILGEYEIAHGSNAFYDGKIPVAEGKAFIGWNKSVNNITEDSTFVAEFADNWNEFADNKTVNVSFSSAVTKAETLVFYRKLSQNDGVRIRLDISEISGFGKVEFILGGSDKDGTDAVEIDLTEYAADYTTVLFETDAWTYTVSAKPLDCSDEEFEPKSKKNILQSVGAGYFGVRFTTQTSGEPTLSLNELCISERSDVCRDAMQWGTSISVDAESERIFGGLTAVQSTAAAVLDTVNKSREFTVEFKDGVSGNVLATRYCYSDGTATAPKVKGYTYDFVSETNVTESKTVSGTGTKNSYTATFSAGGYTFDEKSFGYGDKVVLPTAEDKDVSYKIIVGWSEMQDAAEYTYKAGEEIVFTADKNVLLYPVWGLKTYTVTYLGENGETLFTEKVPHGSAATYGGEIPQKEGYVFDGWDPYPTSVTKDVSVKVVFKSLASDKFRVIIADGTGSGSYAAGETVTISADEKDGFTFAAWSTDGNIEITYKDGVYSFVMPDKDVSIMATYKENTTFASLIRNVFIWVTLALFVVAAGAFTFIFVKKRKNK